MATLEKDCCRSVKPRSERLSCHGRLRTTDSVAVARKLKIHFARYGSPCLLVSDNGPQFVAVEFQKLTKESDIEHMLTSPYNNIIKRMERLRQQSSLLSNCSARLLKAAAIFTWGSLLNAILPSQGNGSSPAQRLMNRRTKPLLPITRILVLLEPISLSTNQKGEREAERCSKGASQILQRSCQRPTSTAWRSYCKD